MKRESRAIWSKRVERWHDSGLSAKEFANETGVNENTLKNWGWRISAEKRAAEGEAAAQHTPHVDVEAMHFVEVAAAPTSEETPPPAATPSDKLELVLASGMTVRVPANFEVAALRRLLTVVG